MEIRYLETFGTKSRLDEFTRLLSTFNLTSKVLNRQVFAGRLGVHTMEIETIGELNEIEKFIETLNS
jgi:hypothetical protein